MKLRNLFFFIFVSGLFGLQSENSEVVIKGKINGKVPEKLEYTSPVNGACFLGFSESVHPDSLGNFVVKVNIDHPSFLQFRFRGLPGKTMIVEPGENYGLNIDLSVKEDNFKISGRNERGEELYNTFQNPVHIQIGARKFIKDSVASVIHTKILADKEKEISSLQKLYETGDITESFYRLVKADRECYYSAVQGTVTYIKCCQGLGKPNWVCPAEYKNMWAETFVKANFSDPDLFRSPWSYSLVENYLYYKRLTDKSFDIVKERGIQDQGLIHTKYIEMAKKELTGNMLEYNNAVYLYTQCIQKMYEKELISLLQQFKKDYPNSRYTQFLEPEMAPIVEYHKKEEMPFNEKSKIIEGYTKFKSLKEALLQLKGKRVYIDVWATWCGPCKAEFVYKEELLKLLQSKNMEIIYISIDKEEKDKQWKEMIKYYNLEGYHIRASEELVSDLRKIFGQNGSIMIPWYILVDENGKILKEHAKPPSQIKELENQLLN